MKKYIYFSISPLFLKPCLLLSIRSVQFNNQTIINRWYLGILLNIEFFYIIYLYQPFFFGQYPAQYYCQQLVIRNRSYFYWIIIITQQVHPTHKILSLFRLFFYTYLYNKYYFILNIFILFLLYFLILYIFKPVFCTYS